MGYNKNILFVLIILFTITFRICYSQSDVIKNLKKIKMITKVAIQISDVTCNLDRPSDTTFQTKFGSITGTVMLKPQNQSVSLSSNLKLLPQDLISEMKIILLGRRQALLNIEECVMKEIYGNGYFQNLQTITGSEVKVYRIYLWRDYSAEDLIKREKLCQERINIKMGIVAKNYKRHNSYKLFIEDFNSAVFEYKDKMIDLHQKDIEKLQSEAVLNFERNSQINELKMNDLSRELNENAKKIKNIDNKYVLNIDTVFYREFFTDHSFRIKEELKYIQFDAENINSRYPLNVGREPKFLMCFAQGGACGISPNDCDDNLDENISITKEDDVCDELEINSTLFKPSIAQRSCNDMCCDCTNFLELLARSLLSKGLVNKIRGIDNSGRRICNIETIENGFNNSVYLGWWKNIEEEQLCKTELLFNDIISDHYNDQNINHIILLGQSHAGKMFTKMITSNNWDIPIDLFILWDAAGFEGAVRSVGEKPEYVLNFFQKDGLSWEWFQQGNSITEADQEYDLSGCLSHNAIPRSVFVHSKTEEVIEQIIYTIRQRARL